MTLNALFGHSGSIRPDDLFRVLDRSQAIICFTPEGKVQWANDNFCKALHYRLEEIVGKHHSMFVETQYAHSADYKKFWDDLRGGEYRAATFKRIDKSGHPIWIQASYNPIINKAGKVVQVVKVATDITIPTMKAKEAIDRTQATISFKLDGTVLEANDNFLNTVGYRADEVVGQHHRMFVDPEYAASPEYTKFWSDLRAGQFQAGEFHRIGKGGKQVWIQASYNPIFDQHGNPYMVTKYATDITQTKKVALETNDVASSVSAATEEMSSSIADIARSMSTVRDSVESATDVVKNAESVLNELVKAIGSMSEIAQLIADISGQINLLALNAAIEAARAGDAGRGFAVVADEVKKLASRTTESTGRIEHEIKGVQGLATQVNETLERIVQTVSSINDGTTTVAAATEEQSSVVNEITKQVTYLADLITRRKAA